MKYLIIYFTCLLKMSGVFAQEETKLFNVIGERFQNYFNQKMPDSIFAMFSETLKKDLPIAKTRDFINSTRTQLGELLRRDVKKYEETAIVYKGYFENGLMDLFIDLDKDSLINGFSFQAYFPDSLHEMIRNITPMILPFGEQWTVTWGGDTKELNYHVETLAQKNAFDFIITNKEGRSYKSNGKFNEDYFAFGKPIIAPCAGEIVVAINGVKDNTPSAFNSMHTGGNMIILRTLNNEYLFFCHLKNNSITLKRGSHVHKGQLLGRCGNSGHSSEPHLHFHVQNAEDVNFATGVKCYFKRLLVNGIEMKNYSPVKSDRVQNK